MSFATLVRLAAADRSAPDASTSPSRVDSASNRLGAWHSGIPISSLMMRMILGAKSGAEFSPVPTAVPPSASSDTDGNTARTRRTVLARICA